MSTLKLHYEGWLARSAARRVPPGFSCLLRPVVSQFEIGAGGDGGRALRLLQSETPAVALLDVNLQGEMGQFETGRVQTESVRCASQSQP